MRLEMDEKYVLRVPLTKPERTCFNRAFKVSGMRSRSEFVRFLVRQYLTAMNESK